MLKLAATCGTILILILAASVMLAFGLPWYMAVGMALFGGCVAGILTLAARLAVMDGERHGDHEH